MQTQTNESQKNQTPLAAQVASLTETVDEMQHGPRVTPGRTVNCVLSDGQVRPLVVVRVRGDELGHIDGTLFFDGSNDARVLPREHADPAGTPCMFLTAIRYDESKTTGTWHWPEKV